MRKQSHYTEVPSQLEKRNRKKGACPGHASVFYEKEYSVFRANRVCSVFLVLSLLAVGACAIYQPTPRPDYAIRVTPTPQGGIATPPFCPNWAMATADPYDNQPLPQYGCAQARNLALQVETPNDLIAPRDLGDMRGVAAVGAVRRYDNNQSRGLIVPGAEDNSAAVTTASTGASALSGDITGGSASGSGGGSNASSSTSASSP